MKYSSVPLVGRAWRVLKRARTATAYYREPLSNMVRWLFESNEMTNFTYDLEEDNARYLAALISDVTGVEVDEVSKFFRELVEDQELSGHISDATRRSDFAHVADAEARYGRRIGWYAFARALKPKVVVETGVDKGLGACVLTAALKRNAAEGHLGEYYGTDINPNAGYLLSGEYARFGSVLYGDSIETLTKLDRTIDLFVNDSDHSADYEAREYRVIADRLSERAVVLGDNAHSTSKLLEFSQSTGRRFVFFQEKPRAHWYPGAGIGISFRR